jgi:hypothetical protein
MQLCVNNSSNRSLQFKRVEKVEVFNIKNKMGGWKLEVFRMTCYVSLPIVCFYVFNKPEYFKELLTEKRRYYFHREDPKSVNF